MKVDLESERADVLVIIGLVLMMGLPILIGYGVIPYTNFGVEVVAVLGMGVLLFSSSLLRKRPLLLSPPSRIALSFVGALMVWTVAKAVVGPISAVNIGTLLIYLGYMSGALGAVWVAHVLMASLGWPWIEKVVTRILIAAAVIAATGSLMQYFGIDGAWMGLSPSAEPGRTYGFVRQPNHQSTYLNLAIAALLYLRTRKKLKAVIWYAASFLLIAALVTTASRTGLIQLLALCAMYAWAVWPTSRRLAIRTLSEVAFMLTLVWAVFYLGTVYLDIPFYGLSKLDRTTTEGVGVRRELWQGAWELILHRPLSGNVIHSFMPAFMIQGHALGTRMVFENAHNMFLQTGFEFGLPAAIILYALLGWLLLSLVRNLRASNVALLTGGILLCILIHAQLEYPLWYSHFLFPFGLCVGIYLSSLTKEFQCTPQAETLPPPSAFKGVSAFGMAVLGILLITGAVTANREFYRLTPVFSSYDESSLSDKIDKVGSAFWFSTVLDLSKYQVKREPGFAMPKNQRLHLLKKIGCERDEPWYQFSTIQMLAENGYLDDAKWLVYIVHDLNPKAASSLVEYLELQSESKLQELTLFAKDPQKVPSSHRYFDEICYGLQ